MDREHVASKTVTVTETIRVRLDSEHVTTCPGPYDIQAQHTPTDVEANKIRPYQLQANSFTNSSRIRSQLSAKNKPVQKTNTEQRFRHFQNNIPEVVVANGRRRQLG